MAGEWLLDVRMRQVEAGVAVVTVVGEVDIATVERFRSVLMPLSDDPEVRLLVCDLTRASFFACSGVSILVGARSALAARGAGLRVVADTHVVLRPLSVIGMLDQLTVSPDVRSALGGSGSSPAR
jgi:anti-sigma B factor antagonist